MNYISLIAKLLYKNVSSQNVIEGKIQYDNFSVKEFTKIATAYIPKRSENEVTNMFNHLVSLCCQDAMKEGRVLDRKLNVFEILFVISREFLDITNNDIRCRFSMLPGWRELTVELSEDLLVTAFLARKLTHESVMRRGFTWPGIIGHDNEHLNAVMKRGISENHSHLNGAAPIFHISWIGLMNNLYSFPFKRNLDSYQVERRYTNILYTGTYTENPVYERYLQAALIRLLLFGKLSGKRIKLGQYRVKFSFVESCIEIKDFLRTCICGEEKTVTAETVSWIREGLKNQAKCRFDRLIWLLLKKDNFILQTTVGETKFKTEEILQQLEKDIGQSYEVFVYDLWRNTSTTILLESMEQFFVNRYDYEQIWEEITLENAQKMLERTDMLQIELKNIQSSIDVMRMEAEREVSFAYGGLDYALGVLHWNQMKEEDLNFLFAGERWLMYEMFNMIHRNPVGIFQRYVKFFYAYLLIKESIRSEMVQSNQNVGFANFWRYQKRKGDFLVDDIYRNIFVKTAVRDNLLSPNIRRMELRIAPSESIEENYRNVIRLDREISAFKSEEAPVEERFFYTLHFIKTPENPSGPLDYFYCRHERKRRTVMKMARAIAGVRERYPLAGERIFGIDAASSEIGCRPEVFATAFRYLKSHRHIYRTINGLKKLPQLRATYHVGEDFLDAADGLRAIDEAVNYLNLDYGDRLGHALALGIDVKQWYEEKSYHVVLSLQDYVDNLVWIYHKLAEYGIQGYESLKDWIFSEFAVIFEQLYGGQGHPVKADIHNYYNAWKLRGDDPSLYSSHRFEGWQAAALRQPYLINECYPDNYQLRELPEVSDLYFRYHFDEKSRKTGSMISEYHMTKNYANAVAEIQRAMQFDIASRGLAIETNPSSNCLIGTFRKYEDHPIVRFFNKGLVHDTQKIKECPQIPVSINTDDQGIFSTSLENEYALMAAALSNVTDDNDKKIYNLSDIYDWLDKIRSMGNDQNFAEMSQERRFNGNDQM